MARSSTMTSYGVSVNLEPAIQEIEKLQNRVKDLTDKMSLLKQKMSDPSTWGPNDTNASLEKQYYRLEKELNGVIKTYEQGVKRVKGIDSTLETISGASYDTLTSLRTTLTNSLKRRKRETDDEIKAYEEAAKRLQKVRDEIAKRDIDVRGGMTESRAKEVMKSIDSSSYIDIKNAIETMKKMQAQLDPNSNKWKTYGKQIADATNYLKKWDDQAKRTQMLQATKGDLGKMSDSDLQQQLRYWDGIVNGVGRTNVAVTQYKKVLDTLRTEQDKRVGRVMTKVEGDDFGGNIAEMQQRLKLLQDYRTVIDSTKPDAYIRVDAAIDKLTQKIKESQAGFLSYADAMKQAEGLTDGSFKGSISDLDKMKKVLEEYKGTISTTDTDGLEKVNTALGNIEQKQKELQSGYISYSQAMIAAAQVMNGSFDGSLADLEKLQKVLTEYRNSLDVKDTDGLKDVDTRLEAITKKMQGLRPGFMSFQDALEKAKQISAGSFDGTIEDLDKLQKVLKEGMSAELNISNEEDLKVLKTTSALIDDIAKKQKEMADINKREQSESKIAGVSGNIAGSSPAEIEEAIRLAKELQKTNGTSATQYQSLAKFINEAEAQLKTWNDEVKHATMENQFLRLTTLSKNALEEQKKYWQSVFDNAEKGTAVYIQAERKLQAIDKEMTDRESAKAGKVMGNLKDYSVSEIEAAIKATEKLRNSQKAGSAEYEIYNEEIKKAKEYLQSYVDLERKIDMEDKWGRLTTLSADALAEQKKYWQEMVNGAEQGSAELTEYQNKLKAVTKEEQNRLHFRYNDTMKTPGNYSVKEVQEAIKAYEQLRDAQAYGTPEWKAYNNQIETTQKLMDNYVQAAKRASMETRLGGITSASTASLAEQKKYWQDIIANTEKGNTELVKYQENLAKVTEEERNRIQQAGRDLVNDYNTGNWDKTIGETKEAIKQLQEYRNTLNTRTQAPALEDVDKVLAELTKKSKEAEQGFISLTDALSKVKDINEGKFDGTVEELEQIKKRLQEIRDTEIKLGAPEAKGQLIEISSALDKVENKIAEVNRGTFNLESVLKHLNTASMKDLNRAAEELKKQIDNTSTASSTFIERSARLREVNKRIEEAKELWKEKENIITKTAKRLASYVLVYAGFNEIVGKLKEVARANLELSDSLADIQKTTGLSAESVAHLSDQINAIDTRSAQKELHDLAYEAGKLGISAEEDVLAFVRAGNQLLVALGEDLGGAEAVRQLMKVNAVLGETQKLGVEKALLATGSAINEISQTSRASAGPIADMVKRIGAIGAASHLSMADLVALAGTADAMGQSAEVAGTAFNKFLGTLQTNTTDVAYTLGLDPVRLKEMLQTEETAIYAIIEIFDKMNLMGEMADLSPIMKDLGSEGARMTQVLTTMAAGVGELKAQVFTSRQAFEEATSVTNEYNIKNESAAAIIERMGNNLREAFTNSAVVGGLKSFLQWLYYLPNALERNRLALFAIRTLLYEIAAVALVKLVSMIGGGLMGALKNATKAWRMLNLEAANSILLNGDRHGLWQRNTLRALAFANGINKVKIAFAALGKVIAANPIFFIGSAIAIAVSAFRSLTEETDKAAKAMAEYDVAIRKEQFEMENLLLRINKANAANGERASLIQQLNNKYGQYLGFLVTEGNYLRNQEYIYKLLNAQIERSIALKMQEKMHTDIAQKYADIQKTAFENMETSLKNIKGIGEGGARDAASKLMESIKEQVKNGTEDVDDSIHNMLMGVSSTYKKGIELLNKQVKAGFIEEGSVAYTTQIQRLQGQALGIPVNTLKESIKAMMEVEGKIAEEASTAAALSAANIEALDKKVLEIKEDEVKTVLEGLGNIKDTNALQEAQSKINDYIREREQTVSGLVIKQKELNSLSFEDLNRLTELNEKRKEGKELTKDEIEEQERLQSIQDGTIGLTDQEYERMVAINKKKAEGVELAQEEVQAYNELQKKQSVALGLTEQESDQLVAVNAELEKYRKGLDFVESKLAAAGKLSLWGDGKTIKDADVNQLVGMYKKLESDGAKIRKGATESIQTSFWKGFDDQKEAIKWYYKEAEKIKNELESRGYNTSGHFLWKGDGGSSGEKEARKEMNAVLAALEEHYLKRKAIIQQAYLDEKISGAEMNRQIASNDEEFRNARIELRKELVGEANTFNQSLYPELEGKDIQRTAKFLQQIGDVVTDGIRKNIQKDEVEIRKGAIKSRQAFEAEMLKGDYFGSLSDKFRDSLDELMLLSSKYERDLGSAIEITTNGIVKAAQTKGLGLSEQEQKERLSALQGWADKVGTMTDAMLKDMFLKESQFSSWLGKLNEDQIQVLISKLREYKDSYDEVIKKEADQMRRLTDARFKTTGLKTEAEGRVQTAEGAVDIVDQFSSAGVQGLEPAKYRAEINLIKEKMAYQIQWINLLKEEQNVKMQSLQDDLKAAEKRKADAATTEAQKEAELEIASIRREIAAQTASYNIAISESSEKMLELQRDATGKYQEQMTRHMDTFQEYSGQLDDFALAMGKGIYGSKEDRQQAARDLLSSVATTTKNVIQQWLMEVTMKKLIDEQELANERYKQAQLQMMRVQSLASTGATMIGEMEAGAALSAAQIELNSAEAASKEAAKKGWIGLAIGAAISVALSALLGAALGRINKAKGEVAAATGASTGRLATGMLTYAEGNYPVLGNDGQVYNAKYEGAGMKTGIYDGGAHFGIFSEKKPEAIIDGDTTQRLILNHPDIWQSIVTLSKTGRLDRGMRTFASGNINELARTAQEADATATAQNNEQMLQMQATMAATQAAVMQLTQVLNQGIHAKIDMYGDGGMYKSMKKAESFASKRGYR